MPGFDFINSLEIEDTPDERPWYEREEAAEAAEAVRATTYSPASSSPLPARSPRPPKPLVASSHLNRNRRPRDSSSRIYRRIIPGQQFSRPADPLAPSTHPTSLPSPPVTALEPAMQKGRLRSFTNGCWKMECFCGAIYTARTADLNALQSWALHCASPTCALPRKKRIVGAFMTRPGAYRHLHQIYGRLYVQEWIDRQGWLCLCACGTNELVRRSVDLGSMGLKRCPH